MRNLGLSLILGIGMAANCFAEANGEPKLSFEGSPFEACSDSLLISKSEYDKNKSYWDLAMGNCGVKVDILPDAGFFKSVHASLTQKDSAQSSLEFLKKVGDKALENININALYTEHFKNCAALVAGGEGAASADAWFNGQMEKAESSEAKAHFNPDRCKEMVSKVAKLAQEKGKEARALRTVVEKNRSIWEATGSAVKTGLSYLMTDAKLPIDLMEASADEKAAAEKMAKEDEAEIESNFAQAIEQNKKAMEQAKAQGLDPAAAGVDPWFLQWQKVYGKDPNGMKVSNVSNFVGGAGRAPSPDLAAKNAVKDFVSQVRATTYAKRQSEYMATISDVPVLAYLNTPNPSAGDLVKASEKLLENSKAEQKKIQDLVKKANDPLWRNGRSVSKPTDAQRAEALFPLMNYGHVVKSLLAEDQSQCKAATGVANIMASSDNRGTAGLVGGTIIGIGSAVGAGLYMTAKAVVLGPAALSAYLTSPGWLATGTSLGFTGFIYSDESEKLLASQEAARSAPETLVYGKKLGEEEKVLDATNALVITTLMPLADVAGMGLYVKGAAKTFEGARSGASMMDDLMGSPAKKAALSRDLQKAGIKPERTRELIDGLGSADAVKQSKAAEEMAIELGMSKEKIGLIKAVASKGLLVKREPAALKGFLEGMDEKVANRAMETFKEINPAKMNPDPAVQNAFLKAAKAGAEFGANPKQIANTINDQWDKAGLEGLESVYKSAKAKLDSGEFKGLLRSETARREMAIDAALKEKGVADDAVRAQMKACAGAKL